MHYVAHGRKQTCRIHTYLEIEKTNKYYKSKTIKKCEDVPLLYLQSWVQNPYQTKNKTKVHLRNTIFIMILGFCIITLLNKDLLAPVFNLKSHTTKVSQRILYYANSFQMFKLCRFSLGTRSFWCEDVWARGLVRLGRNQ